MKKFLAVYFVCFLLSSPAYCIYADDSIDANIKNKYQTNKIEKDFLPALPKIDSAPQWDQGTVFTPVQSEKVNTYSESYNKEYKEIKVRKGTKFKSKINMSVSDKVPRGTKVTFTSVYPETSRYLTIPSGTLIRGIVIDSHTPQLSGNGGLIKIKANEIKYKNSTYYIDGDIHLVNYKRVFFNNVKGQRTYLKNMSRIIQPGKKFLGKTWRMSNSLNDGVEIILIPFALGSGIIVFAANIIVSPALALFSTGKPVYIQENSFVEIKLKEDAIIKDY